MKVLGLVFFKPNVCLSLYSYMCECGCMPASVYELLCVFISSVVARTSDLS